MSDDRSSIRIGTLPSGPHDAITDVSGVRVGHTTLVKGEGPLRLGAGPVRTGVTVVLPHDAMPWDEPVFAGFHQLNGNGELTGLAWLRESGLLTTPIGLTNTHSVGVVRDALVAAEVRARPAGREFWSMPVVGETWDGVLNDIHGQHVCGEHALEALRGAADGPVAQGNVGGGTGMICHGFKGGIGSASRVVEELGFTVGVLVQANHGRRERFSVNGYAVGTASSLAEVPIPTRAPGTGSIVGIAATDAPLLPHQCERLAKRLSLGVARVGGTGEHWSGDLFVSFATGNRGLPAADYGANPERTIPLRMLTDAHVGLLYDAAIEATEAAILNALLAAETMIGRDGTVAYALESSRLQAALLEVGAGNGRTLE